MKKLIFTLTCILAFISTQTSSQYYFVNSAVDVHLHQQTGDFFGPAFFDLENIKSNSDLIDIAISRIENTNIIGQYNYNNGNGTFENEVLFNSPGVGNFIGNVFVKLRTSTGLKDLVVGGINGWEIHNNENGVISGMIHNFTNANLNGSCIRAGSFNNQDNTEDVLISNNSTSLYYFANNMNGSLSNINNISPLMPYPVLDFKLKQMNDKGNGYIQNNPLDKVDIVYAATNVNPDRLVVYKNNNSNGFDVTNPLANIPIDETFNTIIDFDVADFDNDGYNDVVVTYKADRCPSAVWAKVYRNDNGLSFYQLWSTCIYPENINECPKIKVTAADLNKDGLSDLAFTYLLYNSGGIHVDVYLADKNYFFAQNSIPHTIDGGTLELSELFKIDAADIYGGNQSHDGGGIALIISCEFSGIGDGAKTHYVKIINAITDNTSPAAPIVQGLLEYDQGEGVWHPHLHLDNRGERDFDYYEIWKDKAGEVLQRIVPFLQDTGWTDINECVMMGGEDTPYWNVHYYAKSVDKSAIVSDPSRYANYLTECIPSCEGCSGGDNKTPNINQNINNLNKNFSLSNYPNPFNPSTNIRFSLPIASKLNISVYDCLGKLVEEVVNGYYELGTYSINFDGKNLASGIYYYRIEAGAFKQTNKMLLLK